MSQVVTENFHKSLYSSPTGKRKNGTMSDDLRNSLETSEKPLDRAVQMIAEYHGPWTGSSTELTKFSAFVGGKLGNGAKIKKQTSQNLSSASTVNSAVRQMPPSAVGKSNPQTCAIMPTPLLREFLNQAQKMHPAINMYIQNNIDTFPYFQQTSEDVGSFASIAQNKTSVDPMKWPNQNGVNCLDTNSRMNKNTQLKMANSIFNLMDTSNNLLNTLFLRAMPKGNNMSFMHTNYSNEAPISHGHNYTMDVFNGQRNIDALEGAMAATLALAGDALRLINKFFCIQELAKYEVEGFKISMNEGPNGEPVTYIVDMTGRPMSDTSEPTENTDPTDDRVVGTKPECKNEFD
jgi:hypothetical protein